MSSRAKLIVAVVIAVLSVSAAVFVSFRGSRLQAAADAGFYATQDRLHNWVRDSIYSNLSSSEPAIREIGGRIRTDPSVVGQTEGVAGKRAAALEAAHRFLIERFGVGSDGSSESEIARLEDYAKAEVSAGGSLRSELALNTSFSSYYESMLGEPPPGESDEVLFARLAAAEDARFDRISVPTGICLDGDAIAVDVGTHSRANPSWPYPAGQTTQALSYSVSTVSHQALWDRPDSLARQIETTGRAEVAQVHFLLEFLDGRRRVCSINLVWSSRRAAWIVDNTSVTADEMDQATWVRWAY